ncbi:Adipolin [Sciurus carolinensis]|uniref:Adipolin n=1 Tax=Sciurus carolinensis TaxID=30640 RepID=A0AA41N2E0_SCICA|nr:adipolin [Sciurus carolinensis]MBZ3882471.1 Adipolin [Sciurus carolinensis]
MRRWAWAVVLALLWPQLALLRGVGARREPRRQRQLVQRTEAPNATASDSEGLPGSPKPQEASGPEFSDAHKTWLNFVRRPDDNSSKKRCRGRDKKSQGLLSPPGPPGVEVTPALLQEFKDMLKEATERRFSSWPDMLLPHGSGLQLMVEAFHCRLKSPVLVDKKTLVELQGFQAPTAQGVFLRGSGLSLASGRFTAPVSAIFQFSASLHVDHSELQGRARLRARDTVRVLICIESLCHHHTSLEAISGLESNSRVFTAQVQGLLQLQAGQYASVFVDNGSGVVLTIQSGSSFSGLLLGT